MSTDVRELQHDLHEAIEGEVRFSAGDRALYSATGANYRQLPLGVVIPRSVDDVVETVRLCREHRAPLLSRGGGTGLAGQTTNVAVVIDFSKYLNRVLKIDAGHRLARVEPGLILDHLRAKAEREHQLTFGPDPSTHEYCTFGGMIASNSCGVRSIMAQFYGPGPRTSDNVHELEVLLYDGRRLRVGEGTSGDPEIDRRLLELRDRYADLIRERYPKIPRRVSGYNLDDLLPENGFHVARALAGTESTCVTYLEATVHLLHSPPARSLLVLGYEDAFAAGDHVPQVLAHQPLGLEGMDETLVQDMTLLGLHLHDLSALPDGHGWLLVEFGGDDKDEADGKARALMGELAIGKEGLRGMKLYDRPEQEQHVWKVREGGLGATAFLPGKEDTYEGWEDSAVPPERIGDYLRDLQKLASRHGYESSLYGHYGNGCVHARWNLRPLEQAGAREVPRLRRRGRRPRPLLRRLDLGRARRRPVARRAAAEDVRPGARRGVPRVQVDLGSRRQDEPGQGRRPVSARLEHPARARDVQPAAGRLALRVPRGPRLVRARDHALRRRRQVPPHRGRCDVPELHGHARGEAHHARSGAPALGDAERRGAADVARRGGRRGARPLPLLQGLHERLPRVGRHADTEGGVPVAPLQGAAAAAVGVRVRADRPGGAGRVEGAGHGERGHEDAPLPARGRDPPAARSAGVRAGDAEAVVRAAPPPQRRRQARDPLGRHVHELPEPEVGIAAVEALEDAGFHVVVPHGHLCCGRPLYDYGMLGLAGAYLRRALSALREEIRAGTPVVGVEPSCVAVFKDELTKLWPMDQNARRLRRQTFHFSEFLSQQAGWEPPRLHRKALLHGHCHQKATGGTGPDTELLARMALEVEELDAGCCGMAGGWGYEDGHYDVSIACGERVLLPRVREAPPDAVIVADGFSCRSQIRQAETGRRALHVAQVLAIAQKHGPAGPGAYPERAAAPRPAASRSGLRAATVAAGAAAVVAGAVALRN